MSSYSKAIFHLVYSTKKRSKTLDPDHIHELYIFIWGILKNKKCHLLRIGGYNDHIHILVVIPPVIAPAGLVKDIKLASSAFIKSTQTFPNFSGWQKGYGLFSCSGKEISHLIEYIKNQAEHHRKRSSRDELIDLLNSHHIEFDPKYLE